MQMARESAGGVGRHQLSALDDVYAAEIRRLVAFGTLLAGDGPAGEDLAHEAFLQLIERVRRTPDYLRGPAWPLLRTMVARLALQRRRSWAREMRRLAREWRPPETQSWEPDVSALDWYTALGDLPRRMRATVVLFYGEDLSTEQTAAALGCSSRTVEVQLRNARRRLAKSMRWTDIEEDLR
jgi:RNA polymerase sigma factor (sigma-70 family)